MSPLLSVRNKNEKKNFFKKLLTMFKHRIISLLFSASHSLMPILSPATDRKTAQKKAKKSPKNKRK